MGGSPGGTGEAPRRIPAVLTPGKARKADLRCGHRYSCCWWPGDSSISGDAALQSSVLGVLLCHWLLSSPRCKVLEWHCWPLGFPWATASCLAPELAQGSPASLAQVSPSRECPLASRTRGVTSSRNTLGYSPCSWVRSVSVVLHGPAPVPALPVPLLAPCCPWLLVI